MIDWYFITHLGNSLLLLPVALAISAGLLAGGRWRLAARWSACFSAAVLLVLVTKVAFLGWGIGIRWLDFTGISGHTTLASAVLPMLSWWSTLGCRRAGRVLGIAAGLGLALAIGWSRVLLQAHSWSEVVIGVVLGVGVVGWVIARAAPARRGDPWAWAVALGWLVVSLLPFGHEYAGAHGLVVQIALQLSGRSEVFTRDML